MRSNQSTLSSSELEVKRLVREALSANLLTYRQKADWLGGESRGLCRNEQALPILLALVKRLNWPFQEGSLRSMLALGQAFDSTVSLKEALAEISIKEYCERYLGLQFKGDKAKCPLHHGQTQTSFVIDTSRNRWTCFGNCPAPAGQDFLSGDVLDLHQRIGGFHDPSAALSDLLSRRPLRHPALTSPPHATRTRKAERGPLHLETTLLTKYTSRDLGECTASAIDFAKLLLRLAGGGLPILLYKPQGERIIGGRAKLLLRSKPERLIYFCCSTAKTVHGSNRLVNLKERLFLDVEWDHLPIPQQLSLLWHLHKDRGWRLVSITHSGGKSLHGLFYVRGLSAEEVARMIAEALSLGACKGSLQPGQPVRFPGGYNTDKQARQRILYFNPEAINCAD